MSALRSVSTDSSRLPPVAEELEEPPVQMQNVNEKRRDHQQSHKHHHHHKNHHRSSGGNTETEKPPTHLNGSPAVSFQNNAVIIPVLHPNHMAAHRPQPTHIVHGSLRTPPGVIREQYWVYSCRPFRCSNWSRCERIMIVLLISLGTLITVLVVLYIASTKPPPTQGQ